VDILFGIHQVLLFIKNGVLVIPTAFCSWTGEALDKKNSTFKKL